MIEEQRTLRDSLEGAVQMLEASLLYVKGRGASNPDATPVNVLEAELEAARRDLAEHMATEEEPPL